jgi:hypothetical protein
MSRWRVYGQTETPQAQVGDNAFAGLDMQTPDPAQMQPGTYREGYNVRLENTGLMTRRGTLYPGSYNYVQYNQIFGTGIFSDPNGLEWICVAVASGVWFARDGEAPRFIPMTSVINYPVEFVQAFDKLFMFRGPDLTPLLWAGDWSIFWEEFPLPTGGRQTIPNAYTAEFVANRLVVPYGKDHIAVSDIGDYTEYDWVFDDFQINTGQSDQLIRVFPWIKNTVLCFKEHSTFAVSNVVGDLSATTLDQISNNIGLVGRHAVVQVGNDVFFMDTGGVYQISQIFETSPQVQALPLSNAIKPVIDSINWNASDGIWAQSRRERLYFAVPLKNATRNNALLVYNLVAGAWESIDIFADPDFRVDALVKAQYNTERRIFAIDEVRGLVILLEQGKTDIMGNSATYEWPIETSVMTRGYLGQAQRTNFRRVEVDVATWNPDLNVEAYVDGTNAKTLIAEDIADRTKYEVWGRADWNPVNLNDDHANDYREDYSVMLPLRIGYYGVEIERKQEQSIRCPVNMFGRYCQLKIESSQGYLNLRTVVFEGFEDQRAERSQI